jgi:hypothetical protein
VHSALFLVIKLIRRWTPFGSAAFPTHATATAMRFPANAGLSPAEAVFGAQIVLPNEFLQNDELSVDTIVKKFAKTLHVSAPSLPRHNSSTELPSKLPAKLLSAPLVWVRRQPGSTPSAAL